MTTAAKKESTPKQLALVKGKEASKTVKHEIEGRRTPELILGFCGPLGSGVSTVVHVVEDMLGTLGYDEIRIIKLSKFIETYKNKVAISVEENKSPAANRIATLQSAGNALRDKFNNDILAQLAIKEIAARRHTADNEDSGEKPGLKATKRRTAALIDGLKHPSEVLLLKSVYGEMFYLFGIFCAEQIRKKRLEKYKEIPPHEASFLMDRDKSEEIGHGQKLLKTLQHADFFLRNNTENVHGFEPTIERFLQLIFGKLNITPTRHEYAMCVAQSAACRSGCLSRQVGAAIVDDQGNILATGCNDVPKSGGGLYSIEQGDKDNRCFNLYNHECQNDKYKGRILRDIENIIQNQIGDDSKSINLQQISSEIAKLPRLKNLLEFSRAVHAEMDAILSVARNGLKSLQGTSLFSTTFPCHHCARHIIAAGISKVYYIEPYEKSLAMELHEDSIEFEPPESGAKCEKVLFLHFEGVSPKQFLRLFGDKDRKEEGRLIRKDLKKEIPVMAKFLDSFIDYEAKVVEYVDMQLGK